MTEMPQRPKVGKRDLRKSNRCQSWHLNKCPNGKELNIVYAEYMWPNEVKVWRQNLPRFEEEQGSDQNPVEFWFYYHVN
ncbi:LOW QUALITY PROTEIN: hypothetical protein MAR_021680 [Mya arenaria]|uniref:Uncharacterized protein n=1 Tax=Mya arenaria TaxID=6604 RepID=A0ABY7EGN0_MYAAR|nr:LOW QUALITY PROTEIN: hypothetical protein MAR_021680 [Mya arenaria]